MIRDHTDLVRCTCCRQWWSPEFYPTYRFRGVEYRRQRCLACRVHCKASGHWTERLAERNRRYRARVRAQIQHVREARVA